MGYQVNLDCFVQARKSEIPSEIQFARLFMFETGCRPDEFLNLGRDNFEDNYYSVSFASSKTHVELYYSLSTELATLAAQFFFNHASLRTKWRSMWVLLRDYKAHYSNRTILEDAHNALYYLRYLRTLQLLEDGLTVSEIADFFGHIDINNTLLYIQKAEVLQTITTCLI